MLDTVNFDSVFYSFDWHPTDHISFIENLALRPLDASSPVCKNRTHEYKTRSGFRFIIVCTGQGRNRTIVRHRDFRGISEDQTAFVAKTLRSRFVGRSTLQRLKGNKPIGNLNIYVSQLRNGFPRFFRRFLSQYQNRFEIST